MGASFDHGEDGNLHLAREGGHSHHRIVHAADMTGREIERSLLEAVDKDPNIFVFQHHFAIDLLTCQDGSDTVCLGVDTMNTETLEVKRKKILSQALKVQNPYSLDVYYRWLALCRR